MAAEIKPVTYQGVFNFKANLYALEIKSRFIDQSKADGYYKGYGDELAAKVIGTTIQVGTGAFVVQGRMNEVVKPVTLSPQIFDGFVGYIVARIETYHPSDAENCTFTTVVNRTFEAITLKKDDVYSSAADAENKVYELPIYSFKISGNTITELTKLIKPVEDYATIKSIVDAAKAAADAAVNTANGANSKSDNAVSIANTANSKSDNAVSVANAANQTALNAAKTATDAAEEVQQALEHVGQEQGTILTIAGVAKATFEAGGLIDESDTINLSGGGA